MDTIQLVKMIRHIFLSSKIMNLNYVNVENSLWESFTYNGPTRLERE